MGRYFEDEERDIEEPSRDTEVTLSSVALAGIFLALLMLCGLCFALGYWIGGHHAPGRSQASAAQSLGQTAAPDQEPLQGSGSIPKPSAVAQVPATPPGAPGDASQPQAADASPTNAPSATAVPGQNSPSPSAPPLSAPAQSQPPVRPAMPFTSATAQTASAGETQSVHPALPGANQLMVQVAAVSQVQDAGVLVNALRVHGYTATAQRDPSDGLIHVRIGPFSTREEANRMARRLLDDGYNAMVQP